VIAGEKANYGVRITVQNMKERHDNYDPSATIQRLRDDA